MKRIAQCFEALRAEGRKGLVGYLTAGDPDAAASERHVLEALDAGVDLIELGVPFSDPTADGPTIQAAAHRALAAGMTLAGVLGMVRRIRTRSEAPIVLFGYTNPFFRYGYEKVCRDAAAAGADGFLIVDMPHEESAEFKALAASYGLALIPLIAPTTPPARAKVILEGAAGFVYYIMVTGVTGARAQVATNVEAQVAALRGLTSLPIAVGFGVRSGEQARQAATGADAVVVGSALVSAATEGQLPGLVRELRAGLDATSGKGGRHA